MVRYIGSDPAEWWRGRELEAVLPGHMPQIKDEMRVTFEVDEIEAYKLGNVGWASVGARAVF